MSEYVETDDEARDYIHKFGMIPGVADLRPECLMAYEKYVSQGYEPGVACNMALYDWDL
jgi:hypothetical protein